MAIARFLDRMCLALRASGLWLRYATLQNLIPSFPWIAPPHPPPWRNPRKGRDQILPSGNLDLRFPVPKNLPPFDAHPLHEVERVDGMRHIVVGGNAICVGHRGQQVLRGQLEMELLLAIRLSRLISLNFVTVETVYRVTGCRVNLDIG